LIFSSLKSIPATFTHVIFERISTASLKVAFSTSITNFRGQPPLRHPKQYQSCFEGLTTKLGVFSLCPGNGQRAL